MMAALAQCHSPSRLLFHSDFKWYFLLPLFCGTWAELMGSQQLPRLWVQARGISVWKGASESECHQIEKKAKGKRRKKKHPLTTAHTVFQPHAAIATQECHAQYKCTQRRSHTDLNTHPTAFSVSRHSQTTVDCDSYLKSQHKDELGHSVNDLD